MVEEQVPDDLWPRVVEWLGVVDVLVRSMGVVEPFVLAQGVEQVSLVSKKSQAGRSAAGSRQAPDAPCRFSES